MVKKIEPKKGDKFEHELGTVIFQERWHYYNNVFDIFRFEPNDDRPPALLCYANGKERPIHHKVIEGQVGIMQSFYTECIAVFEMNKKGIK